MWYLQKEYP
jgi:hypothetical protein